MTSVQLYLGDCLEFFKTLSDKSVDAVITDVPYGIHLADWDLDMPSQEILDGCLRVSRGPVIWFGAASKLLDFARYQPSPDKILIWYPKFSLSKTTNHKIVYRYDPIAIWKIMDSRTVIHDVLTDLDEQRSRCWWDHPATKLLSLIKKLAENFCPAGGAIFDPYMGSGTTGVACMKTGRDFVGCEIDPHYFSIAERRIKEAQQQPCLPELSSGSYTKAYLCRS